MKWTTAARIKHKRELNNFVFRVQTDRQLRIKTILLEMNYPNADVTLVHYLNRTAAFLGLHRDSVRWCLYRRNNYQNQTKQAA